MKKSKKLNFIRAIVDALGMGGVLWLTALLNAAPTLAAPDLTYSGASRYKDAKDNIYIVTDSAEELAYANVAVTKAPYSDACGFASLKLSNSNSPFPSTIAFNGTSDTVSSMPLVTEKSPYKCVNGVAQWKGTAQTGA